MTESYFRIPDYIFHGDLELRDQKLKPIAFLIEPSSVYDQKNSETGSITAHSLFYKSESGYRYQLGRGNDYKIDIHNSSESIFLLAGRYESQEILNKIMKGICVVLGFNYIYHHEYFESKIKLSFDSIFKNSDSFYESTRVLVDKALIELNIHEAQLKYESVQDRIINKMLDIYNK